MIINIFTHFSGFNYGAFLQALGSQYLIQNLYKDANIFYGPFMPLGNRFIEYKSRLISPSSLSTLVNIGIIRHLSSYRKNFLPSSTPYTLSSPSALFIYGADEILNVTSQFFSDKFFPTFNNLNRSFYLSASLGCADYFNFTTLQSEILSSLLQQKRFTVRDLHSASVISQITGFSPPITCDPAFYLPLWELASVYELSVKSIIHCPFILIYGHHLPSSSLDQIRRIAAQEDLKIVSYPYNNSISTMRIPALTPFELLALFKISKYVVTNMFHGVVLSSILNPRYAFIPNNLRSKKLSFVVKEYNIGPKYWHDTCQSPLRHFLSEIDLESLNAHVQYSRDLHESIVATCRL